MHFLDLPVQRLHQKLSGIITLNEAYTWKKTIREKKTARGLVMGEQAFEKGWDISNGRQKGKQTVNI